MLYIIYDILLIIATPVILLFAFTRTLRGKRRREGMAERFGFISTAKLATLSGCETIWVHAVSVGETIAVKSLLKAIKERFPDKKIVLSNVTETGHGVARTIADVDLCIYFPFDYGMAARRALRLINPSLVVVVETEIWPNFMRNARRLGIPSLLVNGRISDRSFERYMKLSWAFRRILSDFSGLCMQTAEDARRIIAMGAPGGQVFVTRNLKYDLPIAVTTPERKRELISLYHLPGNVPVFTAGSTHPGEEETVVAAYRSLISRGRECFLILVPRHPERAAAVGEMLGREGVAHVRLSALGGGSTPLRPGDVLLVDTIGELMKLYAVSDVVFVGGSFVPVGGHNVLEPASLGVPVLFGPHMSNFREIARLVLKHEGGMQVVDGDGLAAALDTLLGDGALRARIGANGARILQENSGATARHMEIIASLVEQGRLPSMEGFVPVDTDCE